jgi:hypothetical protein
MVLAGFIQCTGFGILQPWDLFLELRYVFIFNIYRTVLPIRDSGLAKGHPSQKASYQNYKKCSYIQK